MCEQHLLKSAILSEDAGHQFASKNQLPGYYIYGRLKWVSYRKLMERICWPYIYSSRCVKNDHLHLKFLYVFHIKLCDQEVGIAH